MARNTGIQAFPWGGNIRGGMTLEDYFAGQALAGNLANAECTWPKYPADLAKDCYDIAAAMIIERGKHP